MSQGNMHFLQSGQEAFPALSYLLAHNSASTSDSLSPLPIYRKDEGNELYKKGDYRAAIDAYSLAIAMSPDEASFYGNRAAAHMMILAYEAAIDDCNKALALSPNMVKAYFRKGKALATLGEKRRVKSKCKEADFDLPSLPAPMATSPLHPFPACLMFLQANSTRQ